MLTALHYQRQPGLLTSWDAARLFHSAPSGAADRGRVLGECSGFLWVDVVDPTPEELQALAGRFGLQPEVLEDIRGREGRPKLHDYDAYLYIVLEAIQFTANSDRRDELELHEVDCLLGPDWVITIHEQPLPAYQEVASRWQKRPDWMQKGPGFLLYELMDVLLDSYFPILDVLDERIDEFEDQLYLHAQSERGSGLLSSRIFGLKRTLVQLRHVAGPTRDVANILLRRDAEAGGQHFAAFQDLYDHASRIVENIDTYREILSGALDAYLASESNRMNRVMKNLTAYSVILLVPTLIAGVFGMNFEDLPTWVGFWSTTLIMALVGLVLGAYFKVRGWL